jgi:hypothetical protein
VREEGEVLEHGWSRPEVPEHPEEEGGVPVSHMLPATNPHHCPTSFIYPHAALSLLLIQKSSGCSPNVKTSYSDADGVSGPLFII